jgi:hypothetical protein
MESLAKFGRVTTRSDAPISCPNYDKQGVARANTAGVLTVGQHRRIASSSPTPLTISLTITCQ